MPIAHHSPFSLCLLLLLLLAVATYSNYFVLTSVHICLSRSSGVLYRSSNADYAGELSSPPLLAWDHMWAQKPSVPVVAVPCDVR